MSAEVNLPYFVSPRYLSLLDELDVLSQRQPLRQRRKPRKWKPFVAQKRR